MPAIQRASDTPAAGMTPERMRTGIIVSVIVGTLAVMILGYVVVRMRMTRGIQAGKRSDGDSGGVHGRRGKEDEGLEVGVVQEDLPAYRKETRDIEKRAEMGFMANSSHTGPVPQGPPSY